MCALSWVYRRDSLLLSGNKYRVFKCVEYFAMASTFLKFICKTILVACISIFMWYQVLRVTFRFMYFIPQPMCMSMDITSEVIIVQLMFFFNWCFFSRGVTFQVFKCAKNKKYFAVASKYFLYPFFFAVSVCLLLCGNWYYMLCFSLWMITEFSRSFMVLMFVPTVLWYFF